MANIIVSICSAYFRNTQRTFISTIYCTLQEDRETYADVQVGDCTSGLYYMNKMTATPLYFLTFLPFFKFNIPPSLVLSNITYFYECASLYVIIYIQYSQSLWT